MRAVPAFSTEIGSCSRQERRRANGRAGVSARERRHAQPRPHATWLPSKTTAAVGGWSLYWSPPGATSGNQRQVGCPRNPRKQAKSVAVDCHRLPRPQNGKEGIDGSSPSEGFRKRPPAYRGSLLSVTTLPSRRRTHFGHQLLAFGRRQLKRLNEPLQRRAPAPVAGARPSGRLATLARLADPGPPPPRRAGRADSRVLPCRRMSDESRAFLVARHPGRGQQVALPAAAPARGGDRPEGARVVACDRARLLPPRRAGLASRG